MIKYVEYISSLHVHCVLQYYSAAYKNVLVLKKVTLNKLETWKIVSNFNRANGERCDFFITLYLKLSFHFMNAHCTNMQQILMDMDTVTLHECGSRSENPSHCETLSNALNIFVFCITLHKFNIILTLNLRKLIPNLPFIWTNSQLLSYYRYLGLN